ncbi:MAG: aminoacetone oxidase family FAD-binding enzyme [Chloroflexi bacterium]|nr:aminoacetone oxidase family FAD-binding enzyme [Chloroflexota bacterium]
MNSPITIVGAGPAGMTAALFAARSGAKVRLMDSNPRVGRKLLVTGSGRANLTNQNMDPGRFTCKDPEWIKTLLARFGHAELVKFLETIGVLISPTPDGWCYPVSESAQTVVDAFTNALDLAGVELMLNTKVISIRNSPSGFTLALDSGVTLHCERLVVAAGGKACPVLGSRGELFASLKAMGHHVNPLAPALAPVMCEMAPWKKLIGVRFDAHTSLYEGPNLLAETTGNLIFTSRGLNGPAVMDLSHFISTRPGAKLELRLNPLFASESALRSLIRDQRNTPTPLRVLLGAVLPPKIPPLLLIKSGLKIDTLVNAVSDPQIEKLFRLATALPFPVTGVRGFEYCQASAGGVPVNEVDPLTLRSLLIPGLFLVGETLDVVGPCGGYNLQFAFSSGAIAGTEINSESL